MTAPESTLAPDKPARLTSLDAYRGFIMLVMASNSLGFPQAARLAQNQDNSVWQFLGYQFDHVPWTGCAFWDLIQPSFMFMVGVALPFSYASRAARGDSTTRLWVHTLIRSFVLIALGIFLSSNGATATNYTFVNVLTQIGLGYPILYLLRGRGLWLQLLALAAVLVGYTYFFMSYTPPADFNYDAVKSSPAERFEGPFAHWDKNANAASQFDLWFLNLFPKAYESWPLKEIKDLPRPAEFKYNGGGYQTLNFIPSLATMILGLMAGEMLRSRLSHRTKFLILVVAGGVCLAAGLAAGEWACPIVKRIWTPSWAVYSSGWTFLMLAAFFGVIDIAGWRAWAFPFVVVGMNSITMYVMAQLMRPWLSQTLKTHFGPTIFDGDYGPIVQSVTLLFVLWLICLWLYRQRIFVRI